VVPLAFTADAAELAARAPSAVVAQLVVDEPEPGQAAGGIVYDAVASRSFARWLLRATAEGAAATGAVGSLRFLDRDGLAALASPLPEPRPVELDQSNCVLFFGTQLVLKLLRAIDAGSNNEDELTSFLTVRSPRRLVPRALGVIEYVAEGERSLVGLVSEYVASQGTAWGHAVEAAHGFLDRVLVRRDSIPSSPSSDVAVAPEAPSPDWARELIAPYPALVDLLARRTAELHLLLASATDDPAFAPEPFTPLYRQSIFQSARTSLVKTFATLRKGLQGVAGGLAPRIRAVLDREDEIEARLSDIVRSGVEAERIRIHGDYHLAQVLFTGDDFVILDFEGEPLRALSERRFKRCPLRDVAGMLRSFDYAAEAARRYGRLRPEDAVALEPWARAWSAWMGTAFTSAYLEALRGTTIVPADRSAVRRLLRFYLLEKCVYEIGYELDNRPEMLAIPLTGLETILAERPA
jgi:maltose alpha-D-glucosyltransferase/alpha-amylase